jgi:hypothetical protein
MAGEHDEALASSAAGPIRADFYQYAYRRHASQEATETRSWIAVDRTTALVLGAIASAAMTVAVAGGTALVQKVDETAKEVEINRSNRIATVGELSKEISVIETKLNQVTLQLARLETNIDNTIRNDFSIRDKKLDDMEKQFRQLEIDVNMIIREMPKRR